MSELSGEYITITGEYDNEAGMNKVLYIVYNPQLTSIKINQSTSITPTIGAKYPFYRKNALTNYRSFSIGGLITYESQFEIKTFWDFNKEDGPGFVEETIRSSHLGSNQLKIFMTSEEKECAEQNKDKQRLDWIYERCFREAILELLLDGKPKLLESEQEGQILVVLTDVTLSPNQQLGRKYSTFTATATEIGDARDENLLNSYNLLPYAKVEVHNNNQDG